MGDTTQGKPRQFLLFMLTLMISYLSLCLIHQHTILWIFISFLLDSNSILSQPSYHVVWT